MKYLGKIATVIIAIILAVLIAVGICVIYSVRNVNVTLLGYGENRAENEEEISVVKQSVMQKVRGRVISSVGEGDVYSCLDESYTLESFIRVYPCTINIIVKQRREVFAVYDGDVEIYFLYDEAGNFLRTSDKNINTGDGAPNLKVKGTESAEDIKTVAEVCAMFGSSDNFNALRSLLEEVELVKRRTSISTDNDRLIFSLWCGLNIEIQDYQMRTAEKISAAYGRFTRLANEQKQSGTVYVPAVGLTDEVKATYG